MHWITGTLNLNTYVLHQNQAKRPLIYISFCNYQFTSMILWPTMCFTDQWKNHSFLEALLARQPASFWGNALCSFWTVKDDLHIDDTVEYLDKQMNITQSCSLQTSWLISSVIQERLLERSAFFNWKSFTVSLRRQFVNKARVRLEVLFSLLLLEGRQHSLELKDVFAHQLSSIVGSLKIWVPWGKWQACLCFKD